MPIESRNVLGTYNAVNNFFGTWGSATWPAANEAIFVPVRLTEPAIFRKIAWANGAAVSGGVEVGVYDHKGTRLVSLSGSQSGINSIQSVDITDLLIGPGLYYLALLLDNTTGTTRRLSLSQAAFGQIAGLALQASASPLPATATFASFTRTYVPLMFALLESTGV